jgi:prepilin-type N-terminal cleavage/methylation domain-containing protein
MTMNRGFTLVETLVAIAILMIAIVGPYYSVQQAIMASNVARDQLIASSLAQEGAEYVYFLRDSNYLKGSSWLTGLTTCQSTNGCTVDPSQSAIAACSSSGCPALKLSTSDLYTQTGSYPVTRFTRTVKLQAVSATEERVMVTVTWNTEHHDYSVNVVEDLYNWL